MIDRFSDGQERGDWDIAERAVKQESTPLFTIGQTGNAIRTEAEASHWREAGKRWCGGTISGLRSKLGYLSRLGITTIWLSPILKQTAFDPTMYHGYATQNFLDIDPHFGTKEDFQNLVKEAHQLNLYVILDIVVNHAGQVFLYDSAGNSETQPEFNTTGSYPVKGWTNQFCQPFAFNTHQPATNDAIWPTELQSIDNFNRRGCIDDWEDENQYLHGDFKLLKDFKLVESSRHAVNNPLGRHVELVSCRHCGLSCPEVSGDPQSQTLDRSINVQSHQPSSALKTLTKIYQYWLAYADLDGYRLDAVKHMEPLATRYFVDSIHNFAKSIGKNNFYIIGEVAGGQVQAKQSLLNTGLDATLGILDIPSDLENMVKGLVGPSQYFQHVGNHMQPQSSSIDSATSNELDSLSTTDQSDLSTSNHTPIDCYRWSPSQIVTLYDDHDQIRKNFDKARFAAGDPTNSQLAFNAAATLICTAGIPCLYYGSEQGFDGAGDHDRYIRECMFGGEFGAFRSKGHHFFNENHQIYQNLQQLLAIRHSSPALQLGQQQLLKISGDGVNFDFPTKFGDRLTSIIPWLRWTQDQIMLCAFSTDCENQQTVWIELPNFINDRQSNWQTIFSASNSSRPSHPEQTSDNNVTLKLRLRPEEVPLQPKGVLQDPVGSMESTDLGSANSPERFKIQLTISPASFIILGQS